MTSIFVEPNDYDPWSFYDKPGLLIGPLPVLRTQSGGWAPDYSHPGVAARVKAEVDFVCDQDGWRP